MPFVCVMGDLDPLRVVCRGGSQPDYSEVVAVIMRGVGGYTQGMHKNRASSQPSML